SSNCIYTDQRIALYCGIPFLLACYVYYHLVAKKRVQPLAAEKGELKAPSKNH
ncbi:hypothetical protein P4547_03940, partial [Geobacillus stearothermophilus]|nr:hypothetical protein [Geobacillus stearothermophilus]MED3774157.1 hypothetical protein [Geobacillus stearothermophilus]